MCSYLSKFPNFATFALIASLFLPCACSGWQDDPFDPFATDDTEVQDSTSNQAPANAPIIDDTLSDGVKLVVKSMREANPTTPYELARAIKSMLNVRQYDEAKFYLQKLINASLTDEQMFELTDLMGPDFFLEVRDQSELQPEGSNYALQVFASAQRAANSPDRISQLVKQLSDEDQFVRAEATSNLRLIGAPAAAEMLNQCGGDQQTAYILSALKQMGDSALLPMLGAARNDGTIPQAVAVSVLANIRSPLAVDALCRAAISSKVPPYVRSIASGAVAKQGLMMTGQIEKHIANRAKKYLAANIELPSNSRNEVVVWNWDFGSQRLLPTRVSKQDAAKLLAVDLARDAYRLNPSDSENRQLQILTVLEATKRVIGPNREMMLAEISRYVPDVDVTDLDEALGAAMQHDHIAAAIGACELLGQQGDSKLLQTTDSQHRNLIHALLNGNRHLQFAAANAISKIDPEYSFPGSSYFTKFMTFLAQSTASSSGIVAHRRPAVAQRLASFVGQSGLQARVAFSPQSLLAQLNSNPDIELILITDSFSSPHYLELVQEVRRNWLTRNIPVGLFVRGDQRRRDANVLLDNDPLTMVLPLTSDPQLIFGQVQRLLALHEPWRVSNPQRNQQNNTAIQWLDRAIEQQERYEFYHLSSYRDQLARLLGSANNWEMKSKIVGNLGTPDAQRELVNLASQNGLPVNDRQVVASAFDRSVRQNGLLLTTADIVEQYARYNASAQQDAASQSILSSILDTIEAKTRRQ